MFRPSVSKDSSEINGDSSIYQRLLRFGPRKGVDVVLQNENAECGHACLSMLSSYHGVSISLQELRAQYPATGRGIGLTDLLEISGSIGLLGRPVKAGIEDLSSLRLPCMLHWKMKHFVVLTRVSSKGVEIVDPKRGRGILRWGEVSEFFTGIAIEFDRAANFKRKQKRESVSISALAGSVTGLGAGLSKVFILALVLEAIVLLVPQQLRMTIDQVLPLADVDLVHFLGISFVILMLLKSIIEALRQWMLIWISSNINVGWIRNLFNHLIRLPVEYFEKRRLGDVVSRFSSITIIQQTLTTNFVIALIDGLVSLISVGIMIKYSWKLSCLVAGFASLYVILRLTYLRAYEETTQRQVNAGAIQQGELIEAIRGIATIRLNNKSGERASRFMNATANLVNAQVVFQRLDLIFASLGSFVTGSQRVLVLWLGATLAIDGEISAGILLAFLIYSDQFSARVVKLADYMVQFKLLRFHAERLADVALTNPELHVDPIVPSQGFVPSVCFENVSFSYGYGARKILNDCSFSMGVGEIVAITGVSGAGKSTIAKLISGIYDYQSGSILIGGTELRALGKRFIRQHLAAVMQSDQLFSGSIFENISLFDPEATLEEVQSAALKAKISNEIEKLTLGYQSPIGDTGSTLSGGQIQRVLLARAFYRKPALLLLDEATSQLDQENELLIAEAVRAAKITTIIIAHRKQTIESADRVIVIAEGKAFDRENKSRE